jgi:hypothetical protein
MIVGYRINNLKGAGVQGKCKIDVNHACSVQNYLQK